MANILHVCGWFDPAGDATRSVDELNKYSEHKHDVIVKWDHPCKSTMQFREPAGQSRDNGFVNDRFDWADAIIYHLVGWNCPIGYNLKMMKPCAFRNANVEFGRDGKFFCLQEFFSNPYDPMYKKVASCHTGARDFMGEDTAFLPALIPINDELYTPDWSHRDASVCYLKHSSEITEGLSKHIGLRRLGLLHQPHQYVMKERRTLATVTIDNVGEGHYGLAGTESLAQGIPAIAWNHPRTLAQLEDIAPGVGNPFIQVNDLSDAVKAASEWAYIPRGDYGAAARNWIETYYNSKYLIERYWEPFVDQLIRS